MENFKAKWNGIDRPVQLGVIGVSAVVAVMMVWKVLPALLGAMGVGLFIAILVIPYWIPTIVAFKRQHPSKGAVLAFNLFLGWSFIGWVLALVWALSDNKSSATQTVIVNNHAAPPAATAYQAGDVVNGHRFDGNSWTPLPAAASAPPAALSAARAEVEERA